MKMMKVKPEEVPVNWHSIAPGVWGMKDVFVNIYMVHNPADDTWVLVDAGLKSSAPKIKQMAEIIFWPNIQPSAIVLTHAHFDHVGSLVQLAEDWDVPVYAHYLEKPYLTGRSSYPPPDPLVGGGMMSLISFAFPKGPIDISNRFQRLPGDGTIPVLSDWTFIHTPGHAPGHISLFRRTDKILLAGDAFVTTQQESVFSVMRQEKKLCGPPRYFTYDWEAAAASVRKLANLEPDVVATGHGQPMSGENMRRLLHELADNFEKKAIPGKGRYVGHPARVNERGVEFVPQDRRLTTIMAVTAAVVLAGIGWMIYSKRRKSLFNLS